MDEIRRQLISWAKNHYWDSFEKDKDIIIKHLEKFQPYKLDKPEKIKKLNMKVRNEFIYQHDFDVYMINNINQLIEATNYLLGYKE